MRFLAAGSAGFIDAHVARVSSARGDVSLKRIRSERSLDKPAQSRTGSGSIFPMEPM